MELWTFFPTHQWIILHIKMQRPSILKKQKKEVNVLKKKTEFSSDNYTGHSENIYGRKGGKEERKVKRNYSR